MGSIKTSEVLQELRRAGQEPLLLFEAELKNYTPYMGGDFDTATFHCIDSNDCRPAKAAIAQQLRGRMRWLARLVLASLEGCGNKDLTYREVEQECFKVRLRTGRSTIEMGLIEFMFGTLHAKEYVGDKVRQASFSSPFKLLLRASYGGINYEVRWKPELSPIVQNRMPRRRLVDRYNALLKRGDKKDPCTGEVDKLRSHALKPLAPDKLEINVKSAIDPFALYLNRSDNTVRKAIPKISALYVSLVLTTLTVFGIGKAVNRGFGRFRLVECDEITGNLMKKCNQIYTDCESLRGLVNSLCTLQSSNNGESAEKALKDVLNSLIDTASRVANTSAIRETPVARIPRLISALKGAGISSNPSLEGLKVIRLDDARSVDDSIEIIAKSVTKQAWKSRFNDPGLPYHTWPLGLPRGSPVKCNCGRVEGRVRYGYYVLGDRTANIIGDNACIPSSNCCRDASLYVESLKEEEVRVGERRVKSGDVRRQSMFVIFPLPSPALVAVIPLYALDLNLVDDGMKRYYKELKLYHVGGHFIGKSPCCNAHVVSVEYALRQNTVRGPRINCSGAGCGCGSDPGGIQGAKYLNLVPRTMSGYLGILKTAYESVKACLQRGC